MGLHEKIMDLGGNPAGVLGRLAGGVMNRGHRSAHRWGLLQLQVASDATVLDIGCGGGAAVRLLAEKLASGKVIGIDHSLEMVDLSNKVNHPLIKQGRVSIEHGSVSHLPFADGLFDAATAFETIQFWPDLHADLMEAKRVLRPGGTLLVINRLPPADGNGKWTEMLQIRTADECRVHLEDAGYVNVRIDDASMPGWIAVVACKPVE